MPEESFEQQARRKAEEFGMEPKPGVWQRVEAAIAPERRRRRVLLWWWLLPLCLGGAAVTVIVTKNKVSSESETAASVAADRNEPLQSDEKTNLPKKKAEEKEEAVSSDDIKNQSNTNTRKNENEVIGENYFAEKKGKNRSGKVPLQKSSFIKENYEPPAEKNKMTISPGRVDSKANDVKAGDDLTLQGATVQGSAKADTVKAKDDLIGQKPEAFQGTNKDKPVLMQADNAATRNKINHDVVTLMKDSSALMTRDFSSLITSNSLSLVAKDSSKLVMQDLSLPKEVAKKESHQKEMKKTSWQVGVMAEIGIASWSQSLFDKLFDSQNKSSNDFSASPSNGATPDTSIVSRSISTQQTKASVDAAFGVAVRKNISKHFYVSAQAGYKYQQYGLYQYINVYVPGTSQFDNLSSYASYVVRFDQYHAHFLNLNTAIGSQLFGGKRNALSAEIGVDNSFLFIAKQRSSYQFNSEVSNRSLSGNFYHWQPQVMVSLPFDWRRNDRVRLVLSPFVRSAFRAFEKNSMLGANNHLSSAGIQVIYFFK